MAPLPLHQCLMTATSNLNWFWFFRRHFSWHQLSRSVFYSKIKLEEQTANKTMHLKLEDLRVHCMQSFEFCNAFGQVCGNASSFVSFKTVFQNKRAMCYPWGTWEFFSNSYPPTGKRQIPVLSFTNLAGHCLYQSQQWLALQTWIWETANRSLAAGQAQVAMLGFAACQFTASAPGHGQGSRDQWIFA